MLNNLNINIARKISKDYALRNEILPLNEDNEFVNIISCRENTSGNNISFMFNKKIKSKYISKNEFSQIVENVFSGEDENIQDLIFKEAIENNASDIHIEPGVDEVSVRMRIDGSLSVVRKLMLNEYRSLIQKIKINANMDITEKRAPQDGKLTIIDKGVNFDIRVSSLPVNNGEKLVLRVLRRDGLVRSIESINFTEEQQRKLDKILQIKSGIVLVNGPTGSGKSTTLYSILNKIKSTDVNITTLEDPIEIDIDGINQVALNKKVNLNFATGLRSILRQDPDIIMVGEIRDSETAEIANRAAITGHKVFSTIHTKTPGQVYIRLRDMGVEEYLLRDSIVGIISQRLIKILCGNCKKKVFNDNEKEYHYEIYEPVGCQECNNTGYKGRRVVATVVEITNEIKAQLIAGNYDFIQLSNYEMKTNLLNLLHLGGITINDLNLFMQMEGLNEEIEI